jgi:glycosyltransferase involved in cell wall biosynthesis
LTSRARLAGGQEGDGVRHIVMITQVPLWSMGRSVGGPAFEQTVRGLARRFRISLVQPSADHVSPGDLPENVTLHPFRHHLSEALERVPKLGWAAATLGWYSFQHSAWPLVRDLCAQGDADLAYGYEVYGAPVARRAGDAYGLPVVTRFQGTLMSDRIDMPFSRLRFHRNIAGLNARADLIIMTNDGTRGRDYLLSVGQPEDRIRFWVNGSERLQTGAAPNDPRAALGVPDSAPLLLTVSRLVRWKRVDRAIRALAQPGPTEAGAYLVVAGTGEDEARLKTLADGLGVSDRVRFAGAVPRGDLAALYGAADLLLSLYDHSNLANPVMESMRAGLPVLALDVGGTGDLVKDGVNGVLLPDGDDIEAVGDRIAALLRDRETLGALGEAASRWAGQNLWTWEGRIRAEADELDSLMDAHATGTGR